MAVTEGLADGVSIAGVEVAEALMGQRPIEAPHLRAMANHSYEPTTVNGALFGGHEGQLWARSTLLLQMSRQAARTTPGSGGLVELSDRLNEINARFRDRVEVVLAQAMRSALRRAQRKAGVRVRKASQAKLAPVRADWERRAITPALLMAVNTDMAELLDESFLDSADQIGVLFDRRQKDRRKALEQAYAEVSAAELADEWDTVEERRKSEMEAFLVAAMAAVATARLERPDAGQPPVGEVPADENLPAGVAADVVRIADGATVNPDGTVSDPQVDAGAGQSPAWDYTDDLILDLVTSLTPGVTVLYEWTLGDPQRPFEPHQMLGGAQFTNETYWSVCAKDPADYPEGEPAYMPGDHFGCQCSLDVLFVEPATENPEG